MGAGFSDETHQKAILSLSYIHYVTILFIFDKFAVD